MIKSKQTTSHKPKVNEIFGKSQKVVSNKLRSFDLEREGSIVRCKNPLKYMLQLIAWLPIYLKVTVT
jgi:hypothetical protein